uniref:ST8 alpha-N-acetyl-neuraminide alpha-2,8-sialyltransferase 6 n=1 Tax=Amphilophus citrinellus TaxID=61819 RepID=A0A3Q0R059_AMPCI
LRGCNGFPLKLSGSSLTCFSTSPPHVKTYQPAPAKRRAPKPSEYDGTDCLDVCVCHREIIDKIQQRYNKTWMKAELRLKCNGFDESIITQSNTPVGSKLVYDGEKKRTLVVNQDLFNMFIKKHPFSNKIWDTCSVVGNSGILSDSGCGKMIDSADFVVRCNLPPLENGYEKDVGTKTNLVTANPSILFRKFGALTGRRRPFIDSLRQYGSSLLLLPPFAFSGNTAVCQRAVYAIEDFEIPLQPVFFNPHYLQNLAQFWRSQGLKEARLSSGLMVASMALEFCENVHLYGFWPFSNHPYGLYTLTNHYYDDKPAKKSLHSMPAEFDQLLQLHTQGVLRLHLGDCKADGK